MLCLIGEQRDMVRQIKARIYRIKQSIACYKKDNKAFGISYRLWHKKNAASLSVLSRYKNLYEGESCFIVGTGPSLRLEDIEKLNGCITFGVNTLYKLYDKTDWRASYYCVIDPTTYDSIKDDLKKHHKDTLFIAGNRINETNNKINQFALNCSSFYRIRYPDVYGPTSFKCDLSDEIFDGASVVYATLEIAVYMGFKNIYLLGVDCNYDKGALLHNSLVEYKIDYKYNWTVQTGITMIQCFEVAKKYVDSHGINIYNATRGGMLNVFPRVDFDEVIKEND